jgi:hypothetical protein
MVQASVVQWNDIHPLWPEIGPEGKHFVSGNSFIFIFGGCSEAAMGGLGAQRPVRRGNTPKKTGARSARARTRGQNPLVIYIVAKICEKFHFGGNIENK